MILMTLLVVWVALFAWMALSCWRAPIGYEDRAGFHYGSATEPEAPRTHRPRPRTRARRSVESGRRLAT